jgi:hypothetical protein
MRYLFISLFCLLWALNPGLSQDALLSPDAFLIHDYGKQFTPHHLLVDYVQHVARHSDRVQVQSYGYSPEDRPLLLAFLSSPANLARLENIRENHLRKTGLLEGQPDAADPISIVWLSFGVHGNEAGAQESAMAVLHALADPANAASGAILENTVIILDPCLNPDGHNRYTSWYRQVAPLEADPAPFAREHREPWPGGRSNHYLFDLNRDWAWATQAETRQRLAQYQRWLPHLHADFHEQFPNSPYYFAPAAEPYHPAITDWQRAFQEEVGRNNARTFDREGWLYFTREVFDLFYPSYGDTYPTFTGAIGMTFEQAGHGIAGRAYELENGDTLTLADRIAHHTAAALATVQTASEQAASLDQHFQAFYAQSRTNPPGAYKSFVIRHTNHPEQIRAFTEFLDLHQIRYGKAGEKKAIRAYDYTTGETQPATLAPEDLIVPACQPAGTLAQILLEPAAGISDSMTYDITAWSMIHAFGLEAWALPDCLDPKESWEAPAYVPPSWPAGKAYAYILPWSTLGDARFLGALLREGFGVRIATQALRIEGRDYDPGALIITYADNRKREDFDQRIRQLAQTHQRLLTPLQSGLVEWGPDLGSDAMKFLSPPRIALVSGEPANPYAFGATWYFFEQVLGYPVSILNASSLSASSLESVDLLILASGNYTWGEEVETALTQWLRAGGRLIATGQALRWVQQLEDVHLSSREQADKDILPKPYLPPRYEDRGQGSRSHVPGALFRASIDNSHPIGYGFPDHYFTLKIGAHAYAYLDRGWNVAYIPNDPLILGWAGAEARDRLQGSLVLGAERIGNGAGIYFADDPLFRAFWHKGQMLFANAVFFGSLY